MDSRTIMLIRIVAFYFCPVYIFFYFLINFIIILLQVKKPCRLIPTKQQSFFLLYLFLLLQYIFSHICITSLFLSHCLIQPVSSYSQANPKNAPITSDTTSTLQFPSAANVVKHPMNVPGQKSNHSYFAMMHITNVMIPHQIPRFPNNGLILLSVMIVIPHRTPVRFVIMVFFTPLMPCFPQAK